MIKLKLECSGKLVWLATYPSKLLSVSLRKDRTPQSRRLLSAQAGYRATGVCRMGARSITSVSGAEEKICVRRKQLSSCSSWSTRRRVSSRVWVVAAGAHSSPPDSRQSSRISSSCARTLVTPLQSIDIQVRMKTTLLQPDWHAVT